MEPVEVFGQSPQQGDDVGQQRVVRCTHRAFPMMKPASTAAASAMAIT
jgi:hypothetical protein